MKKLNKISQFALLSIMILMIACNSSSPITAGIDKLTGSLDPDHDGLTNAIEAKLGTNPNKADTDGDMILDGVEDANHNGIVDANETNPTIKDTDGDGLNDGVEDANHNGKVDVITIDTTSTVAKTTSTKGADENLITETDPTKVDSNGDGISDANEDADGDGLTNGIEANGSTDMYNEDSDSDGVDDGVEDANHNGVVDNLETDPNNPDSDGDGIIDGLDSDANGNGILDSEEGVNVTTDN